MSHQITSVLSISLGVYDTTAPKVAVSVVIDGGADNATSSSVTPTGSLLQMTKQLLQYYYASESAGYDPTSQETLAGINLFQLPSATPCDNATAETKTVNVWFKDAAGNGSGSVADAIERIGD